MVTSNGTKQFSEVKILRGHNKVIRLLPICLSRAMFPYNKTDGLIPSIAIHDVTEIKDMPMMVDQRDEVHCVVMFQHVIAESQRVAARTCPIHRAQV